MAHDLFKPDNTPADDCAAIALGSNLGDRFFMLKEAFREILHQGLLRDHIASGVYETEPVGADAGGPFLNAVAVGRSSLTPEDLLASCMRLEQALGRKRSVRGQGSARTIDLDVLFFGGIFERSPGLILPHPRMFSRCFVMQPLAEIAPQLVLPTQRICVHSLLSRLDPKAMGPRVGALES